MILDDAKEHLQELLRVCQGKADLDKDYLRKVVQFCEEFKTWRPGVYVFVEGGVVQGASANCNMNFELFDADNEKQRGEEEYKDNRPGHPYSERLQEWNETIHEGHESGKLKTIF